MCNETRVPNFKMKKYFSLIEYIHKKQIIPQISRVLGLVIDS